eukprot:394644-Amphidinium_carterae.1
MMRKGFLAGATGVLEQSRLDRIRQELRAAEVKIGSSLYTLGADIPSKSVVAVSSATQATCRVEGKTDEAKGTRGSLATL